MKLSWNIRDSRNLFLKLKPISGLYHLVLTIPKTSPKKVTLTVVEMQHLPDIGKIQSEGEIFHLKPTIYDGRGRVCVNFKIYTDKLNLSCTVTERVRTSKTTRLIWSWHSTSCSWQNEFIFCATLTSFTSGSLYWIKQLFIFETTFVGNGRFPSNEHFPSVPVVKKVIWAK